MRAITIQQPWASAIIQRGNDVENRTWVTNYRGPLLIHAGKTRKRLADYRDGWPKGVPLLDESQMAFGAVIGIATLVDCVTRSRSVWFSGPYGFCLSEIRRITPIPAAGKLGLWVPDPELLARVEAVVPEVVADWPQSAEKQGQGYSGSWRLGNS